MKIVITGASGFLGKHVSQILKENGHDLMPLDKVTGVDILDWRKMEQLPLFDCFIHLAARSYVPDSYEDPRGFYETNVLGTLNALEISRKYQAHFIFISSYIYGAPKYLPIDEAHPASAFNPYAQTKLIGESLCEGYSRDFNMNITILRPFNLYGYGQPGHFLISKIIENALAQKAVDLFDPRPRRDYIHVKDVAGAINAVVEHKKSGLHIYNLGSGVSISIPEIINIVDEVIEKPVQVNYLNKFRPGEIMDTVCNSAKIQRELGWEPSVTFRDGIFEMISKNQEA